jgi:hypothetical protein
VLWFRWGAEALAALSKDRTILYNKYMERQPSFLFLFFFISFSQRNTLGKNPEKHPGKKKRGKGEKGAEEISNSFTKNYESKK